ncbi:hypothetical protein [Ulvibacter antarcticus]|uniref:Uncharacterized protein n=1 Tax=Ulvibacter antarcticus TaxID=442714 RepID=A0A3L9Z1B5_9FLAO|nr:hypothetical protein [Ulvibacter antarcticus]RMA66304.1 hypothetical protein BXY75_0725 [Ulvibacter antarcticus]
MKKYFKFSVVSLLLLFIALSNIGYAQVGVNTASPTKELDVNGELRIRNTPDGDKLSDVFLSTDASGNVQDLGTFRELVYAHMEQPKASNLVVRATGGTDLVFGNGDWVNNTGTTLLLSEVTDTANQYDPLTGLFTVGAGNEGFYYIEGRVILENLPEASAVFDGESGQFRIFFGYNSSFALAQSSILDVFRGRKISGGFVGQDARVYSFIYMEAGDNIKLRFHTYGTMNMNSDPAGQNNIKIIRNSSRIDIYRLF